MATALFERERIRTTLIKAKELRPYAEKLITLAKREDDRLHARRQLARYIHDPLILRKLFDTLGTRFSSRPGGYTRILKLGPRRGDGAEMAILELLGSEYAPEQKDKGTKKAAGETKKSEPKPAEKAAKGGGRKKKAATAEAE